MSFWVLPTQAADAELDALNLESAPAQASTPTRNSGKFFIEGAYGRISRRDDNSHGDSGRVSLDLSYNARVAPGLRVVVSDRLDYFNPKASGAEDSAVNSFREGYLSWQSEQQQTVLELGRINLRYGPGYGYNPTDFFRDNSLRVITTANPFSLRENRLGTVMLRAQQLWNSGSLSFAYSPKLADRPSNESWNADIGATNYRDRAVLALGSNWSEKLNTQLLLYKQNGLSPTVGASMTGLLSDATVAHIEWSRGKDYDLFSQTLMTFDQKVTRSRLAGGVTYTTSSKLALTAEVQYNGFALSDGQRQAVDNGPSNFRNAYFATTLRLQDLGARHAYLVYATQKNLFVKDLDLTALLRYNADDHSRLLWVELRRHWAKFDLAFQLQQHDGRRASEFGSLTERRAVQLVGSYYF